MGEGIPFAFFGLNLVPVDAHFSPFSRTKKLYILLKGLSTPDNFALFLTLRRSLNLPEPI